MRGLEGERTIAIVMNASSPKEATQIDYLVTNKLGNEVTPEWFVKTFNKRLASQDKVDLSYTGISRTYFIS